MLHLLLLSFLGLALTYLFIRHYLSSLRLERARKNAGCLPAKRYPNKEPFLGLDLLRDWMKAEASGKSSKFFVDLHKKYGRTFEMKMCSKLEIHTIEPRNLQALAASQFEDFGFGPIRGDIGAPFIGRGFVTEDGDVWKNSRAIVKPCFTKAEVANLPAFERHIERFMRLIPDDGATFDMQTLADRLFLDSATEFLFGQSVDSLLPETPFDSKEFLDAFERALQNLGLRMLTGPLNPLLSLDPGYKHAYTTVHRFIDMKVQEALERRKRGEKTAHEQSGRYVLLDSMAEFLQDPIQLRDQITGVFLAARGNSGPCASNIFWYLAKYPRWWQAIREEALSVEQPYTFEKMKSLRVARAVINEVLRLQSPIGKNRKAALKDTILPVGGGLDGTSPVFVPKGTVVDINIHALHRDPEIWGEDYAEFKPERWLVKLEDRPMWESKWQFAPFFGGLRMCVAQNQVYVQMAYLLLRTSLKYPRLEFRDEVQEYEEVTRIAIASRRGVKIGFMQS